MIKILHVVSSMNAGGVENVVYSYMSNLNRKEFEVDIACYTSENGVFRKNFENIGMNVYRLPSKRHALKSVLYQIKLIKKNKYDIVHVHLDDQSFLTLFAATMAGTKIRILHTHLGNYVDNRPQIVHGFMKKVSLFFANKYFACSEKAAREFFGNTENVFIMRNGINVNKYKFNIDLREKIRTELGYTNKDIVIGSIARLTDQKNPIFLIKVFKKIAAKNNNAKLLFVGDGYLFNQVKEFIKEEKLEDKIKLLGAKINANEYYNALDIFALPSKFEGFGISFIEAQINGLLTYASDNVPLETKISNHIKYLSLNESIDDWALDIEKTIELNAYQRYNDEYSMKYEISYLSNLLEQEYKSYDDR